MRIFMLGLRASLRSALPPHPHQLQKMLCVAVALVVAACARTSHKSEPPPATGRAVPAADAARAQYPNLAALYGGDAGIYRTCAANQGVCHNDKEHPNLATLGAVVQAIGAPCNITKTRARDVHDLCERPGDHLAIGGDEIEIASYGAPEPEPLDPDAAADADAEEVERQLRAITGQSMEMRLRRAPKRAKLHEHVTVKRPRQGGGSTEIQKLDVGGILREPGSFVIQMDRAPPLRGGFGGADTVLASVDPLAVHVGDPNENGVFGAELGGALIVPGRPDRSYLLVRLTDPSAGPLMPRANCCTWTKTSLRALYCWVAGLRDGGKNALDMIDYDRCPPGPVEDVIYPEPGVACETSGMCPVQPRAKANDATWTNVYRSVLAARCGGSSCHTEEAASELDLRTEKAAFKSVTEHLVPKSPARSEIFIRVSPDLCHEPDCTPMPLRKPALDAPARDLLRRWIERGAPHD